MTLLWLAEQYVDSGKRGNSPTRRDSERDLQRYVYPYFRQYEDGDVDIALIQTRPLPTLDGTPWPVLTMSGWKTWLQQQPLNDRAGNLRPGTALSDKTRGTQSRSCRRSSTSRPAATRSRCSTATRSGDWA